MTAWDEVVLRSAVSLAALAGRGPRSGDPAAMDVEVAVTARAAVLAGAAVVLRDLAPAGGDRLPHGQRDLLALTERHPVRALGILLQDRGRPRVSRAPSDLLDAAAPGSAATRQWAAVGRDALVADRIWSAVPRQPEGDQAWHAVRQVAALTELVAALDPVLAGAAAAASRSDVVAYLDRTAGLRLVAREVRSLADAPTGAGQSQAVRALTIGGPESRRVITPTDGQSAAAALRRLTTQIKAADELAPNHVRVVATLGRDLSILAAKAGAIEPSGRPLRDDLGGLAVTLNQVVAGRHGEAMLVECRAPALEHQIRELSCYTRAALGGRAPLPAVDEASRLAGRLPRLLTALADKAREQVELRHWAIPDRSQQSHLRHTVATTQDPDRTPRMLTQLDRAVVAAETLRPHIDSQTDAAVRVGAPSVRSARQFPQSPAYLLRPPHPAAPQREHLPPSA
ncbi:hypothetical protein [Sporichthya sp.]|uniref:hypothetical protein n=1 Tax=Sporichthya sp. TaxID=65475 RepID=UPI001848D3FA|nr:hypothetical protein [Sporichthya sp.]MBA3741495.1 hypothetical protein [Sporichthya sp.]